MKPIFASLLNWLKKKILQSGSIYMAQNPRYRQFEVGQWTYGSPAVLSWGEGATLRIGRYCSIAPEVTILLGGEHRVDWVTTYPFSVNWEKRLSEKFGGHPATKGDVEIGNDVWIGKGALILSGVKIGDGAVIGANSVVSKNVAPYAVVAGNPACQVKLRFSPAEIDALESIAWWNWPEGEIQKAMPLLLSGNIAAFIDRYRQESPRSNS